MGVKMVWNIKRNNIVKNKDGNMSVMFAVGVMVVLSGVGIVYELGNLERQKNNAQNALDTATLSVAIALETQGASVEVQAKEGGSEIFVSETNDNGYSCTIDHITVDSTQNEVASTGTCETKSMFPFTSAMLPSTVSVSSATAYGGGSKYEIALMLDASGSMGGAGRMTTLKTAVSEMIETLIPQTGESNVRISLAPYDSSVNAGIYGDVATGVTDLYAHTIANLGANPNNILNTTNVPSQSLDNNPLLAAAPNGLQSVQGLVRPGTQGGGNTGGPANSGPIQLSPNQIKSNLNNANTVAPTWNNLNWGSGSPNYNNIDWSSLGPTYGANLGTLACVSEREGANAFTNVSPVTDPVGARASQCPAAGVEPLSDHRATLLQSVNTLAARGSTAGHLGVAWSWYTLSHDWRHVWPHDRRSEAQTAGEDIEQIAVLMTDGVFNAQYAPGQGNSKDQAEELCDAMKDDNVTVYSIAYSAPSSGQAVMQYCASSPEHYFYVRNSEEVKQAYAHITGQIGGVRIAR